MTRKQKHQQHLADDIRRERATCIRAQGYIAAQKRQAESECPFAGDDAVVWLAGHRRAIQSMRDWGEIK